MQEDNIYEYAIIRLVPRIEREEFFNVGVIMFSKKQQYIRAHFHLCHQKFNALNGSLEKEEIVHSLENFLKIAHGDKDGGEIAKFDIPERFRWLTALRSSVVQTSRPHPGKTNNLDGTFDKLFEEFVL